MSGAGAVQIPSELGIDLEVVRDVCRTFIQEQFKKIGARNAILGLSGGIDSALVGFLTADALGADRLRTYILPYRTSAQPSAAALKRLRSARRSMPLRRLYQLALSSAQFVAATSPPASA